MSSGKRKIYLRIPFKSLSVRNGRAQRVNKGTGIVGLVNGLCEILAASQVYGCRKARTGVAFWVLCMRPANVVNTALAKIGKAPFAVYKAFIACAHVSSILIAHYIR